MNDRPDDAKEHEGGFEFMLPVVPEEIEVDPILLALLHCSAFLDFAEDEVVDPDLATEVLDHIAYYVRRCSAERLKELEAQLKRIRNHATREAWPAELIEFVGDFLENCTSDEDEDDNTG
jgi:hypothetical protein